MIICTYGVPSLPGTSLIYGGLQTHITMLGEVTERHNPYFVPPAESSAISMGPLHRGGDVSRNPLSQALSASWVFVMTGTISCDDKGIPD